MLMNIFYAFQRLEISKLTEPHPCGSRPLAGTGSHQRWCCDTSVQLGRKAVMYMDVPGQCAAFKNSNEGNGNLKGYSPNQEW